MSNAKPTRSRRERSARYPGVPLREAIEFCRSIADRGLDGLPTSAIAEALGYKNIKTNTFSARLSAARQFGLLRLSKEGLSLTPLARSILHPVDPGTLPGLYRQALREPPLYAELSARLAERKVPPVEALANLLYHHFHITATAKASAAEAFLESARFAEALGADQVYRPDGPSTASEGPPSAPPPTVVRESKGVPRPSARRSSGEVRIDLQLWGRDQGKMVRVRAPDAITSESFERLIQALRLHVRIEGGSGTGPAES